MCMVRLIFFIGNYQTKQVQKMLYTVLGFEIYTLHKYNTKKLYKTPKIKQILTITTNVVFEFFVNLYNKQEMKRNKLSKTYK